MATVLIAWELGGGMGHLSQLRPIALALMTRGHRVVGVFRDLERVPIVFGDDTIEYVQSPAKRTGSARFHPPGTYAEMLANIGFGDAMELQALLAAWRTLYDLVGPDLVICDHSPTALLAARGYQFKRAVLGTGFFCPAGNEYLPALRPAMSAQAIVASELVVLNSVNAALERLQQPRLKRLSDLYREVDETIFTTFAELDHFGARESATYWGALPVGIGQAATIDWPEGDGPRVFGYLKSFQALEALLERLATLACPTVIVSDGISTDLERRFLSERMRFLNQPLDAASAAGWCDIGLLNATHGMLCALLLAGKPTVNVPVQLEQRLLSLKVVELRAGVAASADEPDQAVKALDFVLANRERLADGAARFCERYRDFDPAVQVHTLIDRLVALLPGF
jgi:hypothetical protein